MNSFQWDKINVAWDVEVFNNLIKNSLIQFITKKEVNWLLSWSDISSNKDKMWECLNLLDSLFEEIKLKAKCVDLMFNEAPRINEDETIGSKTSSSMQEIENLHPEYFYNMPAVVVYDTSWLVYANSIYLRITWLQSLKELKDFANSWYTDDDWKLKNALIERIYQPKNREKVYEFISKLKNNEWYSYIPFEIWADVDFQKTYMWSSYGLNDSKWSIRVWMDITSEIMTDNFMSFDKMSDEEITEYINKSYVSKRLDWNNFNFSNDLNNLVFKLKSFLEKNFWDWKFFINDWFIDLYKKLNLFAQMWDVFFDKWPFIMNIWQWGKLKYANSVYTWVLWRSIDEINSLISKGEFYSAAYWNEVERSLVEKRVEWLNYNSPHYNESFNILNKDWDWIFTHFDTYLLWEKNWSKTTFRLWRIDPSIN